MHSSRSRVVPPSAAHAALVAAGLLLSTVCGCASPGGRSAAGLDGDPEVSLGCVADAHGRAWSDASATGDGRYAVRSLDLTFVDTTRETPPHGSSEGADERTLPTMVWYPQPGLLDPKPASGFPIVMYSHGFASNRKENTGLARHLASHGFVVVAPTFPSSNLFASGGPNASDAPNQPRDVSFVLDRVLALGQTRGHALYGRLDASRVAAVGLSMGGLTTLLVTYHPTLRDPRIDVAIAMAPPAGLFSQRFYETTRVPLLVLHGSLDAILPYEPHATTFMDEAVAPAALLTLDLGTHTGFTSQATLIDLLGYDNVDTLGCNVVGGLLGDEAGDFTGIVAPLGGEAAGVSAPPIVPSCQDDLDAGMEPRRQLEIVDAAVLSFLTAHVATDATERDRGCDYLARQLPAAADLDLWLR